METKRPTEPQKHPSLDTDKTSTDAIILGNGRCVLHGKVHVFVYAFLSHLFWCQSTSLGIYLT